jgi:demethylmenaquinone methyltransferase/2-methoxy-6-polyprenyl-1,4-benzoquinol methylase
MKGSWQMNDYNTFEYLTRFREPLIDTIINSLGIKPGSKGIDIGCGIGYVTNMLGTRVGHDGHIIGLDFSEDFIEYAKKNVKHNSIEFLHGDVNYLDFKQNSFDWIWSMDTIWAGPEEFGCPAEKPDQILNKLHQILKPGGMIYLVFWSSQKLLPGYPLLEARLNASTSANAPYLNNMNPDNHILNGKKWLSKANFKKIDAKTFLGDITAPLDENDKKALKTLFQMFWGSSEKEVSREDWEKFNAIRTPGSNQFILSSPDYYGFYTYTLFQGEK